MLEVRLIGFGRLVGLVLRVAISSGVACRTCRKVVEMPGGFSYQYGLVAISLRAPWAARLVQGCRSIGVTTEGE